MRKIIDLTGKKFGDWDVIEFSHQNKWKESIWKCKCSCGTEKLVNGNQLRRGMSKSCHYANRPKFEDNNIPTNKKEIKYEVNENGCWICTSHSKNRYGYCMFRNGGKKITIHRYMYEQHNGKIPENMCVCHTCDNPSCINPEHLFLGTHKENMKDRSNKDRQCKGYDMPARKLTEQQVMEIRKSDETNRYLGKKYGVSATTIQGIQNGITWKYLLED
jgi:hypothetical protein